MKENYHNAIYFDVDETLIFWEDSEAIDRMLSRGCLVDDRFVTLDTICFRKHNYHIDRLIQHHNTGDLVVVWSAGGKGWADRVVDALEIREFVDVVLPKPNFYYDDIELKDFNSRRMFFDHETLKFVR